MFCKDMKNKILFILVLAVAFVVGCSTSEVMEDEKDVMEDDVIVDDDLVEDVMEKKDVMLKTITSESVMINKNKYLVGGKEQFNSAKVFFTQKVGKGFNVEVDAKDKQIKVEVMTDLNCVKVDDGLEYETISEDQGTSVKIVSEDVQETKRDICISIEAVDSGEITAHVLAKELTF
jgi:hypothetical protein